MTTNSLSISSLNYIKFSSIPSPSEATVRTLTPFTVQISASNSFPHRLILYSQNSRSSPLNMNGNSGKWSHLIPTWRFLDTNFSPVTSVLTTDTQIFSGTTFVGVTGEASFYYVDDLGTPPDSPLFIWATLDLSDIPYDADTVLGDHSFPSHINSKMSVVTPFFVNSVSPSQLKITRNGINELGTAYYWISSLIGNTITINGEPNSIKYGCSTDSSAITIIYDYPQSNQLGISAGEVQKGLVGFSPQDQKWSSLDTGLSSLFFQELDIDGFRTGGYIRSLLYPFASSLNATVTASANVFYSSIERTIPFVWINNSTNNYLHKINDIPVSSTLWNTITSESPHLSGGDIKVFKYDTPYIETVSDIYPLSGFGGGFGVAMDPCFNVWITDYEMDRIYKYNSTGVRLSSIELNGLRKLESVAFTKTQQLSSEFDGIPLKSNRTSLVFNTSSNSNAYSLDIELPENSFGVDYYKSFRIYLSSSQDTLYSKNDFIVTNSNSERITVSSTRESVFEDTLVLEYKLASNNDPLSSLKPISLSAYGIFYASNPSGISIDSEGDLWVSFFNDNSIAKMDSETGELLVERSISDYGDVNYPEELSVRSTLAETDSNNNVWVSYNHPLSSKLIVFDTNGTQLSTTVLPMCSEPVDMCFDLYGDLWITLAHTSGPPYLSGGVWKIDGANMTVLSAFSAVNPEFLTVDKENNAWFTEGINTVTRIKPDTSRLSIQIGNSSSLWFDPSSNIDYNFLEGIAADTFNRIWVINSKESRVYIISGGVIERSIDIVDNKHIFYNNGTEQYTLTSEFAQSIQAFGDWSGLRWMMKYNPLYTTQSNINLSLTGQSDVFSIDSFDGYYLRKFNESSDTSQTLRDYALPYHIWQNYNLFINYLGTMVGGLENENTQIGRYAYERIANFVSNHSDPDTANLDQMYSLCEFLDVPIDDYRFSFPFDIKRIIDIGSISHSKLFGYRCNCRSNFQYGEVCATCGHNHDLNVGEMINTSTYIVSSDIPFLAEYRLTPRKFEVINSPISSTSIFNIASTYLYNPPQDYNYYYLNDTPCNQLVEGVINWGDEYTTISPTNSSLSSWYDKGQILEKMFSMYLYKGLGL